MKYRILVIVSILMLLFLSACGLPTEPNTTTPQETTLAPQTTADMPEETTQAPSTSVETTCAETVETTVSEVLHSDLYIPGVSVEDVILYFNEVCLDSEYVNSGDPSYVQKWTAPIYYTLEGDFTEEDIEVMDRFIQWLNTIEGFPGMQLTELPQQRNLRIDFCSQEELIQEMGEQYINSDGAVTFWYQDDIIYDEIICYRTDIPQEVRNSVILEEIYNGLGPIQDTALRSDSIIYCEYSIPQQLTAVDELILRLLYHPDMRPGMNAQQCEQVIRSLYY